MYCGGPLPARCNACGTTTPPQARFCPGCGGRVAAAIASRTGPVDAAVAEGITAAAPAAAEEDRSAPHGATDELTVPSNGARKHVTVLFVDIVGSTRALAALDPEDARRVLDRVMHALRTVIERGRGVIAKTMGDGLFVIFGAPLALENHAYLACHTALELQRMAATLELWQGEPVRLRVGLHTGVAVVFLTGEGPTATIDATGDVVNRAAHLEARAAVGTVLISSETQRQAGRAVETRPAPPAPGRKGADQECHELLGCGALAYPGFIDAADQHIPFTGRRRERMFLRAAVEDLAQGRGDVLAIVGDAGSGKTRLLAELAADAVAHPVELLGITSAVSDRGEPNALLRRVVLGLLEVHHGHGQLQTQEVADRLVAALDARHEAANDVLWLLFGGIGAQEGTQAEQARNRAHECIRMLLTARARARPLLLALDDYQWSDQSSRAFLTTHVRQLAESAALLVVFTCREDRAEHVGWARQPLHLSRMPNSEMTAILDSLPGMKNVDSAGRERILDRCDGNPRFLVEIARSVNENSGGVEGDQGLQEFVIPESVADLFEERIDRLTRPEKRLLQLAGAFEGWMSPADAGALAALPEPDALQHLQRLERAGLLRTTGSGADQCFLAGNPVVAKAAYRSLLRDERQSLHARIRAHLQQTPDASTRQRAIARHAFRAGEFLLATRAFHAAGASALARLAYGESIDLLRAALRADERTPIEQRDLPLATDLRLALRDALFTASGFDEIERVLGQAKELARAAGDPQRLRSVERLQVTNLLALGRYEQALPFARALAAEPHGDAAEAHLILGQVLASLGLFDQALGEFDIVLAAIDAEVASGVDGREGVTRSLAAMWALWCASEQGRFEAVMGLVQDSQRELSAGAPPLFRTMAAIGTGLFWLRYGDLELAADTLRKVLPLTQSDTMSAWYPAVASPYGLALVRMGRAQEALPYLQAAVQGTPSRGGAGRGQRLAHLSECQARLGRGAAAEATAQEALQVSQRMGESGMVAYARYALALACQVQGKSDAAAAEWREAMAVAQHLGMRPLQADLDALKVCD